MHFLIRISFSFIAAGIFIPTAAGIYPDDQMQTVNA